MLCTHTWSTYYVNEHRREERGRPEKRYLLLELYVNVVITFLAKLLWYCMYHTWSADSTLPSPPPLLPHPPSLSSQCEFEKLFVHICILLGLQFGQTKNDDSAFQSKYVWPMGETDDSAKNVRILNSLPFSPIDEDFLSLNFPNMILDITCWSVDTQFVSI